MIKLKFLESRLTQSGNKRAAIFQKQ